MNLSVDPIFSFIDFGRKTLVFVSVFVLPNRSASVNENGNDVDGNDGNDDVFLAFLCLEELHKGLIASMKSCFLFTLAT